MHRFVGDESDGGGAQAGDPAQPLDAGEILADAGGGEHAPISHQDQAGEAEAGAELVHLAGHRLRVAGVAFEDFDGDGAAFGGALELVLLAVAAVAAAGEGAMGSFHGVEVRS